MKKKRRGRGKERRWTKKEEDAVDHAGVPRRTVPRANDDVYGHRVVVALWVVRAGEHGYVVHERRSSIILPPARVGVGVGVGRQGRGWPCRS